MHQQHILLAVLSVAVSWQLCISQYVYSGLLVRRPPPARRSAMEALERLRLPPARYFPQVDSQVPSYPGGVPPYQFYSNGEVYALPPQWTEEGDQGQQEEEDEYQGSNYEYEEPFRPPIYRPAPPPFAQEIYPQESDIVGDMYRGEDDFQHHPSWPMAESGEEETFVQRRNGPSYEGETNETATAQPLAQQVHMTAIPSSPEKKNVKSLVLPDVPSSPEGDSSPLLRRGGQKEEPLFRPLQTSQRTTTWETRNATNKSPIPLLKQMITSGPKFSAAADPLLEELNSLKKSHV